MVRRSVRTRSVVTPAWALIRSAGRVGAGQDVGRLFAEGPEYRRPVERRCRRGAVSQGAVLDGAGWTGRWWTPRCSGGAPPRRRAGRCGCRAPPSGRDPGEERLYLLPKVPAHDDREFLAGNLGRVHCLPSPGSLRKPPLYVPPAEGARWVVTGRSAYRLSVVDIVGKYRYQW